jgi:hypothetical protein
MRCCVFTQLVCRRMAFMDGLSWNVCMPTSSCSYAWSREVHVSLLCAYLRMCVCLHHPGMLVCMKSVRG